MTVLVAGLVLANPLGAGHAQNAPGVAVSRDWKRLRSQNFVAMGTGSSRSLQQGIERLEAFRTSLVSLFPRLDLSSPVPNQVIVLNSDRAFNAFAPFDDKGKPQTNLAGYFMSGPDVNLFVINAGSGRTFNTLFHEYTHFVLHRSIGGPIPDWVDEGLAEFYGAFEIDDRKRRALIGLITPRYGVLRDAVLLPVRKMITSEGAAEYMRDENDVQRFYAQSWALVHYLVIGHAGAREGQLNRYLAGLAAGKSSEGAFEDAFGVTPEKLQDELRAYLSGLTILAKAVPLPEGDLAGSVTTEPMFEWEALRLQGDLSRRLGRFAEADKALSAAQAAAPTNTDVLEALGALRSSQDRPDEAIAILEPIAAQRPRGFVAQFYLASALADAGRHEAAIPHYERAAANGGSALVWLGLSVSHAALGHGAESDSAMARLLAIDPDPAWYRARAYRAWRLGNDALVVRDALAYVKHVGFDSESATYTAFMGALAGRRSKAPDQAKLLLDGVAAAVSAKSWPSTVLAFLNGGLGATVFIARAKDNGQRTEAHAYVGLMASIDGRDAEALLHLQWVMDRGSRNYYQYSLARDELARLAREGRRR
jgi:tetratricopeptide (TPR) repeat protein